MVVEYEDGLYGDLFEDVSVSTVTVSPNVTEHEVGQMQTQEVLLSENRETERLNWYSLSDFWLQQILDYEEFNNDTELEYEEYEIYEDDFDFAERERAETLNVEVNLNRGCVLSCLCQVILGYTHLFMRFSTSGYTQSRKGPKGRAGYYWTGELLEGFNK